MAPHRFEAIAERHPWAVLSQYNDLRFREVPPSPKPAGVTRIVLFGDSFTEGQGVKADDTLARVLERRLNEGPGRYEVRNCGRRGLDFPELMEPFAACMQYEPDLIVYALVLNDAARPPEFQARQSYVNDWILDRENLPDDAAPAAAAPRSLLFDFARDRFAQWRVGRETTRWYLEMWSDANPGWASTQQLLVRMKAEALQRHARLLVTSWPLLVGLDTQYPFAPVHRTSWPASSSAPGSRTTTCCRRFDGRRPAELWVHPVDRHPNEIAQRIAADSLLPALRLALPRR